MHRAPPSQPFQLAERPRHPDPSRRSGSAPAPSASVSGWSGQSVNAPRLSGRSRAADSSASSGTARARRPAIRNRTIGDHPARGVRDGGSVDRDRRRGHIPGRPRRRRISERTRPASGSCTGQVRARDLAPSVPPRSRAPGAPAPPRRSSRHRLCALTRPDAAHSRSSGRKSDGRGPDAGELDRGTARAASARRPRRAASTASPRLRRTSAMLQTPHRPGQFETTPGSIGQKYSVSLETGVSAMLSTVASLASTGPSSCG